MIFRSLPVRAAFLAALALAALATALVLAIGWQSNRALSARTLADLADEVADLTVVHATGGPSALQARIGQRLTMDVSETRILHLVGPDGKTIAGTFTTGGVIALKDIARDPVFTYRSPRSPAPRLAVGRLVTLGNPASTLLVARDIEDERSLAFRIQMITLGGLSVLGLSALAFGFLARRSLLKRIEAITTTSQAIMAGQLTERIPRDASGDELDTLAGTLNDMLSRIDSLMQALREVSDNIAHDLKTPISRLRNTAERAMREPAPVQRETLGIIIEQADGIIQTFNALLQIARLEQGAGDSTNDALDLAELVTDVVELYEPVAETLNIAIRREGTVATPFRGNRQLLGQALANLIDNALKYSSDTASQPEQRDVSVVLQSDAAHHRLIVSDRGPGIPASDRETALKRFGRLDASRSLPGTGLGLSVVVAIARLHGGRLTLADNIPHGLQAILELPARKP